ncbi:hypothetical protein L0244_40650 [bacterium]|nr:hypothetical protein [bacterium]
MESKVIAAGLPSSGKSTFLAAFWHVVNDKSQPSKLSLSEFKGEFKYLNDLSNKWLRCEEIGRTLPKKEQRVEMKLNLIDSEDTFSLSFPDLSGERFRRQWRDRATEKEIVEEFKQASGILFFIHSDNFEQPTPLIDINVAIGETKPNGGNGEPAESWTPEVAPTQVKLVDLLQLFTKPPLFVGKRRIAVMLSACDLVPQDHTPTEWLCARLPLLHQYLKNSGGSFEYRVFGVSAQGGRYDNSAERKVLEAKDLPKERIKIATMEKVGNDITLPVAWVMGHQI